MTGLTADRDVLLMAIAVAAFAACFGIRLALWWAGPRKAASLQIDAGVAYLRTLPVTEPETPALRPCECVCEVCAARDHCETASCVADPFVHRRAPGLLAELGPLPDGPPALFAPAVSLRSAAASPVRLS